MSNQLTIALNFFKVALCVIVFFSSNELYAEDIDQAAALKDYQESEIDKMRTLIDRQSQQLDDQQRQLDLQRQALQRLEAQLLTMDSATDSDEVPQQTEHTEVVIEGGKGERPALDSIVSSNAKSPDAMNLNFNWTELDKFPTDIAGHRGLFLTSADGNKLFRFYGSLRSRAVWDNQDIESPWTLDLGSIPAESGGNGAKNLSFSALESRFGFDVDVRDLLSVRAEFDFRGSDDELRIRQLYLRNKNWVIGKTWPVMNTINFLPLSLDYHAAGGQIGTRFTQLRYMNGFGNWSYHLSLEDIKPKLIAPGGVDASSKNTLPTFAAALGNTDEWGEIRVSGLVTQNRVDYVGGTQSETGWGIQLGMRLHAGESDIFKAHINRISGMGRLIADLSSDGAYDIVYNPANDSFENLTTTAAAVALEHYWIPELSTSIGGGYVGIDVRSFQDDLFYDHGYKGLLNLIWRPKGRLDGLLIGIEGAFGSRTNNDGSSTDASRISAATYYDF